MAVLLAVLMAVFGTGRGERVEAVDGSGGGVLRFGARAPEVTGLQEALLKLGYFGGPVSGYYGPQTQDAVKRFQTAQGLGADGVFGPRTRAAMERAIGQATHVVKRGESLGGIAVKHGVPVAEIVRRNAIADPDRIRVGQELIIPGQVVNQPPAAQTVRPSPPATGSASPPAAGSTARRTTTPPIPPPLAGERVDMEEVPGPATAVLAPFTRARFALTFNDGPDPEVLPLILAALAERGVKATFFVVGEKAEAYPELVRRLAAEGHEVENHAYTHRDLTRLDAGEIQSEVSSTAELINRLTGRQPRYFRPPLGAFDLKTINAVNDVGHRLLFWTNIGAPDRPAPATVPELVDRLAGAAFDGAILMLHADSRETAAALPALLDRLKNERYRVLTASEMLADAR